MGKSYKQPRQNSTFCSLNCFLLDPFPTPSSSSSPPAQKRSKTSSTTFQPKTLTPNSPLLPMGLDISGYDFKVNEVSLFVYYLLCLTQMTKSIAYVLLATYRPSSPYIL
jgi:hypothetical protein